MEPAVKRSVLGHQGGLIAEMSVLKEAQQLVDKLKVASAWVVHKFCISLGCLRRFLTALCWCSDIIQEEGLWNSQVGPRSIEGISWDLQRPSFALPVRHTYLVVIGAGQAHTVASSATQFRW